jgi:DNA-binding transcriptional LysR family regulator
MRLAQLEYFVAIAEEGSYAAASTRLIIAQPSLSQQISALEKELGCRLFERLPRGVRLTSAGREFFPDAQATVLSAQRARRAARAAAQLETGSLEIATVGSMAIGILPKALAQWHRIHPDVAVNVISYRHRDALEAAVASGVSDLAVGPTPRRWSGESIRLGREEFVVVLPLNDPAAVKTRLDLSTLADRHWVTFDRDHGLAEWLVTVCAQAGFVPQSATRLAEVAAAVGLAAAGLGPTFVPANVVPPGLDAAVCRLQKPVYRNVAAYARTKFPDTARTFLDALRQVVGPQRKAAPTRRR